MKDWKKCKGWECDGSCNSWSCPGSYMGKMRGFTLIELMIVVCIIAIMCATVLPALKKKGHASEEANCIDMGYPETKRVDGKTYCVRLKNGTTEVRPLSELIAEHGVVEQ